MLTSRIHEETIIELRAVKDAAEECRGVNKVPLTLYLLKVANNSYRMYKEYLRKVNAKKRQKEAEK